MNLTMKSKVQLSIYAYFITCVITGVLFAGCIVTFHEKPVFYPILGILIVLLLFTFLFAPISIKANKNCVNVRSLLRSTKIPVRDIAGIELFQPTMGTNRICGSGGYMGYWGIFRESDIGRYTAYYGKASDCFIIKLKNGDKYVLGCKNPSAMVNFIKSQI